MISLTHVLDSLLCKSQAQPQDKGRNSRRTGKRGAREALGCRYSHKSFPSHIERGSGHHEYEQDGSEPKSRTLDRGGRFET
jgi:hypothetical protein